MKLYIWRPQGHGQSTLGVIASSIDQAIESMDKYALSRNNSYSFPGVDREGIEEYSVGQVFENDNS